MSERDATPEPETNDPANQTGETGVEAAEVEVTPLPTGAERYERVDEWSAPPLSDDWMTTNIDEALAAVASLSEMMPEREAEAQARADAVQVEPTFIPEMSMPPLTTLRRGQLGSVIPALLLIGIGAWLTLTMTAGTPPNPLLLASIVFGGIIVSLLAQWISSGRWSRGGLFFALFLLFTAAVIALAIQPNGFDIVLWYPLVGVAFGLALILSGLLARPVSTRVFFPGVLVVLGGVVGLIVTLGMIPDSLMALAAPLTPIVLVVALVLFLLPLIFRRRRPSRA